MKERNKTKKWTVEQLVKAREEYAIKHADDSLYAELHNDVILAYTRVIERMCRAEKMAGWEVS